MADVSLDTYIQQKGPKLGGRLGNRLGNKKGQRQPFKPGPRGPAQRKPNTQFTVTGVGNIKQRLGRKSRLPDARQKILQKTKFTDARSRIELKKSQSQTIDVRNKINNAKAKRVDARQLLKARQQKQQPRPQSAPAPVNTGPRFMVTGLGRVGMHAGADVHSIPTIQTAHSGILKTIHSSQPTSPSSLSASAVAGNIVKTINNENTGFSPHMMKGLRITKTLKMPRPKAVQPPETYYEEEDDDDDEDLEEDVGMRSSRPLRQTPPRPTRVSKPPPPGSRKQVPAADVTTSAQGYRVIISNLHSIVSQEDIIELFGAIGDIRKARLVKAGTAEVIYKERSDAQMAVKKYHQRELDGLPMSVVLGSITPKAKVAKPAAPAPPPARAATPPSPPAGGPLRLGKHSSSDKTNSNVDSTLIHKALFKTSSKEEPSRPVTFTVKI